MYWTDEVADADACADEVANLGDADADVLCRCGGTGGQRMK